MTESDAPSFQSLPTAPEDPRLSFAQILRLHERVRETLREVEATLDSPAVQRIVQTLEDEHGSRVSRPLIRLRAALEETVAVTEATSREVALEMARFAESHQDRGEAPLPPGLARFVAERSSIPGFRFETGRDPMRGAVVRWQEVLEDGSVRAGGILYERPFAWIGE